MPWRPAGVSQDRHCDMAQDGAQASRASDTWQKGREPMDHGIDIVSDLMEQARAAGADDVGPRSAFVQGLPELSASSDRPSRH